MISKQTVIMNMILFMKSTTMNQKMKQILIDTIKLKILTSKYLFYQNKMVIKKIKEEWLKHYKNSKLYFKINFIKSFFAIWIILWLWLWYNYFWSSNKISTTIEYIVDFWNITNSIKAFWSTEIVDEQQLRFNQQWEVIAVYFKKWDEVKKWDIIAELDQDSVLNDILQAEINLANSKLQLEETLKWNKESQILQAANNLEQTKLKLNIAKEEYINLIEALSNSWSLSDRETVLRTAHLDIQNYIIEWEKIINQLDTIFGVSNSYRHYNDNYEIYLWAKNSSYKNETEQLILLSYSNLWQLKDYYTSSLYSWLNYSSWNIEWLLIDSLNLVQNLYKTIYEATNNAYKTLENSVSSTSFSQSTIDSYKNETSNNSSKTKSSISNILTSINKINNLSTQQDDAITIQTKENEIKNLEKTIIIQEKTLEDTKEWNTEQQIQIARNGVRQRELALENTKKWLDNLRIEAPFDWKIRKIDFKKWDKITSDEQKYVYLENPDLIEISILIDQIDVVNISQWMSVEVILDSYPWEIFEWVLWDIDSTPIVTNWVTSYTVKVAINKLNKIIYSGMTATAKIIIEDKKDIIVIPTTFIQSQLNRKYVLNKNNRELDVIIWATDWATTEIISWLDKGNIIIKNTTVTKSSSSSSSNSFAIPWMWWWMWWWMRPN